MLVPDLDQLHGHLLTRGADLLGDPVPAFVTRLLELVDCSGNLICLVEGSPAQFGVGTAVGAGRLPAVLAGATETAVQARSMIREKTRSVRTRSREHVFRRFYDVLSDRRDIYYMFFTSGLLPWVAAAESHVPAGTNLVLVGSALTDDERAWIAAHLDRPFHHVDERIDDIAAWQLLFAVNRHDFGWLDVNYFVLNPDLFAELADIDAGTSMNCTWSMPTDVGIPIAGTHLLFVNRSTIEAVRAAGVPADPGTFDWAGSPRPRPQLGHNRVPSPRVRELLLSVLPDHGGRPAFVTGDFYDTLMVYQLLAHALGHPTRPVRQLARRCSLPTDADSVDRGHWPEDVSEELFHLCGISYYERFSDNRGILSLYFAAELTMLDRFLLDGALRPPQQYQDKQKRIRAELSTRGCLSAETARDRFRRHLIESRGLSDTAATSSSVRTRPHLAERWARSAGPRRTPSFHDKETLEERKVAMLPVRHFELPAPPNPDQLANAADNLTRLVRERDPRSLERTVEHFGAREQASFGPDDARSVVAGEFGYDSWAALQQAADNPLPPRHISRLDSDLAIYRDRVQSYLRDLAGGNEDAARRFRGHVPRLTGIQDTAALAKAATVNDARVVVAHEVGCLSWPELVGAVERRGARKQSGERWCNATGTRGELLAKIRSRDTTGTRAMLADHPELVDHRDPDGATLLETIIQPAGLQGTTADLSIFEALIDAGADLNRAINLAAGFNRIDVLDLLLAAGADITNTVEWGITPLEAAILHGNAEAAQRLASHGLVPLTLWVAAGSDRTDLLERMTQGGQLDPTATRSRPDPADIGWPIGPPPEDDDASVLAEAFISACHVGATDAARWLLDHGADIDATPSPGLTGLHYAVSTGRRDTVEMLLDRGANTSIKDDQHGSTALQWAQFNADAHPESPQILQRLAETAA